MWFIIFAHNIYKHFQEYYRININELDLSDKNFVEIWNEYCKLRAFQKLYSLFSKKKIKISNIIITPIIVLLNIPLKILKLIFYFIFQNKTDFKGGLKILYYNSYYLLKNCKIEVFNKKIYLNCYTIAKLLRKTKIF